MGIILYIIAWVLEPILTILNFIAVLIKYAKIGSFWKVINEFFYQGAVSKDKFGNYNYRTLLNLTLIKKKSKHLFGNVIETISSVLGKNQVNGTLTIAGWLIVILLWIFVHPKHWNIGHCKYYIDI